MSQLKLRYKYDGTPAEIINDFGWLELQLATERRSGIGGFWVQWQDISEFGQMLGIYPIQKQAPPSAKWGYTKNGSYETVLAIEIAPANSRGDLIVRVEIADPDDPGDCVKTSFQTNYSDLATFSTEVAQLMAGEIEEARLNGQ